MKQIFLSNSPFYATVDDEDYERVSKFKWHLTNKGYVAFSPDSGASKVMLHNFVLNVPPSSGVDHKDRNPLNNGKTNLRIATDSQQAQNRGRFRNNTSGYKGVSLKKKTGKYQASIKKNYMQIFIGYFNTAEDAARAYDQKAIELFGPNAMTNFTQEERVN